MPHHKGRGRRHHKGRGRHLLCLYVEREGGCDGVVWRGRGEGVMVMCLDGKRGGCDGHVLEGKRGGCDGHVFGGEEGRV